MQIDCRLIAQTHQTGFRFGDRVFCSLKKRQPPPVAFKSFLRATSYECAVLDLNGDGKLEVIVHSFYYEGGQTTIYCCELDKIEAVLSVECGA
jgi:hypothetical protein